MLPSDRTSSAAASLIMYEFTNQNFYLLLHFPNRNMKLMCLPDYLNHFFSNLSSQMSSHRWDFNFIWNSDGLSTLLWLKAFV